MPTPARTDNGHAPAQVDQHRAARAVRELLSALGEDPARPGLLDTPDRVARWWSEFLGYDTGTVDTSFECHHDGQLVAVSGIRTWSLCEHHLLPVTLTLSVGYRPAERVLGLSKLARIVHGVAHGLQLQERLTEQVADQVARHAGTPDVGVVACGEHLCMAMRGVRTEATMTTSVLRGALREDPAEFLALA